MKSWEIWGREDEPANSSWDGWTKLITCNSFKPSGKPVGENTDEDNQEKSLIFHQVFRRFAI